MALAPQGSARGRSSRHRQSQIARLPSSLLFLLAYALHPPFPCTPKLTLSRFPSIAVSIPLIQASSLPASGLLSNRAQASTWKPAAFNPASGEAHLAGDFVCRSMGECEPCPASEVSFSALAWSGEDVMSVRPVLGAPFGSSSYGDQQLRRRAGSALGSLQGLRILS